MTIGAILAGGQARRFGSDKALAEWRGKALIDHVAATLAPHVDAIVICGRDHPGAASIPDRPYADLGPLGGINAALHHARAHGHAFVLSLPCDTPLIDEALLAALGDAGGSAFLAAMPVIGLWESRHAAALDDMLAGTGSRSIRRWAASIGAAPLELGRPLNINRPEDLHDLPA